MKAKKRRKQIRSK